MYLILLYDISNFIPILISDIYYQAFQSDPALLKTLIYFVYLLELAQTILVTQNTWEQFVTDFGNIETFDNIDLEWVSISLLGGLGASWKY